MPAPVTDSTSPTLPAVAATLTAQPGDTDASSGHEVAAVPENRVPSTRTPSTRMPSTMMLSATAGILIAFAISVAFLIRERRLHRQELEERELDHWRRYR